MKARTLDVLGLAVLLLGALACSNRKTPVPGKTCVLNSECESPLTCTFMKCHEACRANGDCPNGGLCVYTPPAAAGADALMSQPGAARAMVCVDESCAMNSQCPGLLICGRDLRCRQECAANKDCPSKNQLCVIGNDMGQKVCAEPIDIGDDGQLLPGDGGAPPASDAGAKDAADASHSGVGGGNGQDASDAGKPDAGVADVSSDDLKADVADAPADIPDGDAAGTLDAPADVAAPDAGDDAGPVVVTEQEPNDDINAPAPYVIGTEVAGTMGRADGSMDLVDYYEVVTPPGDPSGGYFQASVGKVGSGAVFAAVFSASDNGMLLLADGAAAGQSTSFFWAGKPGQHYLVRLYEGGGVVPTFKYAFRATYTRTDDPFEPNDTSDTPAPLALGTPATAYFFAGYTSADPPVPDQDWYEVTLAAGTAHVTIDPVPHDLRVQYLVYDSHFVQIAATNSVGANPGASIVDGTFTAAPGKYRIAIQAFSFVPGSVAGRGTVPPDSFTRPYMITVTQP